MGSYSTILTTLQKHFTFLFKPFINLLQDGFCSHGFIFHYCDHPSSTQRFPIQIPYEFVSHAWFDIKLEFCHSWMYSYMKIIILVSMWDKCLTTDYLTEQVNTVMMAIFLEVPLSFHQCMNINMRQLSFVKAAVVAFHRFKPQVAEEWWWLLQKRDNVKGGSPTT